MLDIIQTILLAYIAYTLWPTHGPKRSNKRSNRRVILDTCALIDGRIIELSKSGFVPDELIVPEFILHELQLLADGTDSQKRSRARFGLDVVKELQDSPDYTVSIDHTLIPHKHATDDKLVALAKKLHAQLYTTDYNLNKVAEIEGVRVLNVNELAQNLRPSALPGEKKQVKLVQKGSNPRQGVGYLDDGTMLVVEDSGSHLGKTVTAEITRTHQTVAGKMLFGVLADKDAKAHTPAEPATTKPSIPIRRAPIRKKAVSLAARMKRSTR